MKLRSCHKCLGFLEDLSQRAYDGQYISQKKNFFTLQLAKKKNSFLGVSVLVESGNGLIALNFDDIQIQCNR